MPRKGSKTDAIRSLLCSDMRNDGNRGITGVSYDYGHHPYSITISTNQSRINNDYTPDGRKLSSQQYRSLPSAETVLMAYYEPAERSVDNFMKAVDIQQTLRQQLRPIDVPSIKKLTTALKACGFRCGAVNGQRGWYARRR